MQVAPSRFCPSAAQTAPCCMQASGAGQGGTLSALQLSVALPLSQKSELHGLQRVAGRALFLFLQRFHGFVQCFALRVLGWRQVPFASLVSRFHGLVCLPVQRAHAFGHQAPSLILPDLFSLPAFSGVGVKPLARGGVDLLCSETRGVGVNGLSSLVASVHLSVGHGADHGDQGGSETSSHVSSPSNVGAWLSIADFLALQNLRAVLVHRAAAGGWDGKRSAATPPAAAREASAPHGNHGENNQ